MRLSEWQGASFREHNDKLFGFVDYLSGVWQNRNRYVESSEVRSEEELQKEMLQHQRFFDFSIDGSIYARNYVGVVQYEDIRIEVYPKVFNACNAEQKQQWHFNLLYWLSYCKRIKFPFSLVDISKVSSDDFLELLIYVFANFAEEVLANQPFQTYQVTEEETTFLKGRLSFDNYTKHNLITGKWQHFYCLYEPFLYDNKFNRIVKYVTSRLIAISKFQPNKEKLNSLLFLLHDVSDVNCVAAECATIKLNPLFEDHKHILALCELYLSSQVIDMSDEGSRNFCFLVPMEYVFEDFIFGFISAQWPSLPVISQSTEYLALNQEGEKVFQIRNDLYIPGILIIDTKYKMRQFDDGSKAGVIQSDMYQMISYVLRRNCNQVLLLYPKASNSLGTSASFNVSSDMLYGEIEIAVYDINIVIENIKQADAIMRMRMKELLLKVIGNTDFDLCKSIY